MKNARAPKYLDDLVAHYKAKELEIENLKRRVRELTKQRDQSNARNDELRAHITRYQAQLALARREWSPWPSQDKGAANEHAH